MAELNPNSTEEIYMVNISKNEAEKTIGVAFDKWGEDEYRALDKLAADEVYRDFPYTRDGELEPTRTEETDSFVFAFRVYF